MNLESLKKSKFNSFQENELTNSFKVLGGVCLPTKDDGRSADYHDTASDPSKYENNPKDTHDGTCPPDKKVA